MGDLRTLAMRLAAVLLCICVMSPMLCAGISFPADKVAPSSSCHENGSAPDEQPPVQGPGCCLANQHPQATVTAVFTPRWQFVVVGFAERAGMNPPVLSLFALFGAAITFAPTSPPSSQNILRV